MVFWRALKSMYAANQFVRLKWKKNERNALSSLKMFGFKQSFWSITALLFNNMPWKQNKQILSVFFYLFIWRFSSSKTKLAEGQVMLVVRSLSVPLWEHRLCSSLRYQQCCCGTLFCSCAQKAGVALAVSTLCPPVWMCSWKSLLSLVLAGREACGPEMDVLEGSLVVSWCWKSCEDACPQDRLILGSHWLLGGKGAWC